MGLRLLQMIFTTLAFSCCLIAQSEVVAPRLVGIVKDESGASISGVTVELIDRAGRKFQAISRDDGQYSIRAPDGLYSVTAEHTGQKAWKKYFLKSFEITTNEQLTLDITLKPDPNFTKIYGSPVEGTISESDSVAVKLIELDRLTKAIVDQKLVPIWKSVKCDDPSSLYLINYGSQEEVRRRRNLIVNSIPHFKCDLTGFRITFVDGPNGPARTVIWHVPAGTDPPKP